MQQVANGVAVGAAGPPARKRRQATVAQRGSIGVALLLQGGVQAIEHVAHDVGRTKIVQLALEGCGVAVALHRHSVLELHAQLLLALRRSVNLLEVRQPALPAHSRLLWARSIAATCTALLSLAILAPRAILASSSLLPAAAAPEGSLQRLHDLCALRRRAPYAAWQRHAAGAEHVRRRHAAAARPREISVVDRGLVAVTMGSAAQQIGMARLRKLGQPKSRSGRSGAAAAAADALQRPGS
mmetsp:Transcript_87/g.202  ORF Transcript_87/g.202 Transcript_87/m.202 type:complete len:241 (+) Transcript_87:299-1021(+)